MAKAFSHKPTQLSYNDDEERNHNGSEKGYLYTVVEPITINQDIYHTPKTVMDKFVDFLTSRPLCLRLIEEI